MSRLVLLGSAAVVLALACAGCSGGAAVPKPASSGPTVHSSTAPSTRPKASGSPAALPGMPPLLDPHDVWAADRPGTTRRAVVGIPGAHLRTEQQERHRHSHRPGGPTGDRGPSGSATSRSTSCPRGTCARCG